MALVRRLSGAGSRGSAFLAAAVAVSVPLSSVPMASNRSAWWLLWSALFALLFLTSLMRAGVLQPRRRLPAHSHTPIVLLAFVLPVWAIVQVLPIAFALPDALIAMPSGLEGQSAAWISLHPDIALSGILRFAGYVFLGMLVFNLATRRERVLRLAAVIYAGVVAQALWALLALNLFDNYSPWGDTAAYQDVATGTFVNRNSLATYLGFGIILGIGLLAERLQSDQIRTARRGSSLPYVGLISGLGLAGSLTLLGIVFLSLALVQTQSRLGLTATVAASIVTIALLRASAGVSVKRLLVEAASFGLVLLLVLALLLGGGGVLERFLFVEVEGFHRLTLYGQTLEMIWLRPWTGYGMDAFGPTFEAFRGPELNTPAHFDLAHNTYLTLWVEFGLLAGSSPLLAILLLSAVMLRRIRVGDGYSGLAVVGIGVVVLAGVHSLGDFSLEIPANAYLFVTLICLAAGRRSAHIPTSGAEKANGDRERGLPPVLVATQKQTPLVTAAHLIDPEPAPILLPAVSASPAFVSVRNAANEPVMAPLFRSVRPHAPQIGDPE